MQFQHLVSLDTVLILQVNSCPFSYPTNNILWVLINENLFELRMETIIIIFDVNDLHSYVMLLEKCRVKGLKRTQTLISAMPVQ